MNVHVDTLRDLANTANTLALAAGDLVYDLELAGLVETGPHQCVMEARNALNRAISQLDQRVRYAS